MEQTQVKTKRTLTGTVVFSGNDKTVAVLVERFVKHPKYAKFYRKSKKYQVHDENNECQVGDKVRIEESAPLSKKKRFRVIGKV